jgi:hypothetical protein
MGLEHMSRFTCQGRGGSTGTNDGDGVDVRQLLAVEVVHGRAACALVPGGAPDRGGDKAEDDVHFGFVARPVGMTRLQREAAGQRDELRPILL